MVFLHESIGVFSDEEAFELYRDSVTLRKVADGLNKIAKRLPISQEDRDNLERGATLLGRMDFDSGSYFKDGGQRGEVDATRLRPLFYRVLSEVKIPFSNDDFARAYKIMKFGKVKDELRRGLYGAIYVFNQMADIAIGKFEGHQIARCNI